MPGMYLSFSFNKTTMYVMLFRLFKLSLSGMVLFGDDLSFAIL